MSDPVNADSDNQGSETTSEQKEGRLHRFLRLFGAVMRLVWASKIAVLGLAIVLFWVIAAILAPCLTPYSPTAQDWEAPGEGPSWKHPLGTDELGRDLWSRLIYGARVVLVVLPITDNFWIPGGIAIWGVLVSLIVGAPGIARLVRGLTLDIRTRDYIGAAVTRGESAWHIMVMEILPNARGPVIIDSMLRVGYAIFAMGTLGFLGLGLPPPSPDWGSMVAKGRQFIMMGSPWAALWPSLAIASLVVGLNFLADGLREEMNRYQ